jgi:5,10-methylene-tetrahydrofolate dehydrogenase/methenyl tetrahydrofolate cyclohydrolase
LPLWSEFYGFSATRALNRVQQRATELIKFAADNFKLQLDYSQASIPRVEHALAEIHKHTGAKAGQNKATIVNLSNGFGSYLGEVLRRNMAACGG